MLPNPPLVYLRIPVLKMTSSWLWVLVEGTLEVYMEVLVIIELVVVGIIALVFVLADLCVVDHSCCIPCCCPAGCLP